jgi:predicted CopG family antitoxin
MTKSIQVDADVHADLMLLKRVKNSTSISELLRLLMDLCKYNNDFFELWDQRFKESGE